MTDISATDAVDLYASDGRSDHRLVGNMAAVALGKAVVVIAGLASMAVLARYLGPTDFGYYRTALTYMSLAAVPADLGLYMVTLREITRPDSDRRAVLAAAMTLRLIVSALILTGAAAISFLIPYDPVVHFGIWLSILLYVGFHGIDFLACVFQARMAQTPRMIGEVLGGVTMLAAVIAVAWLGGGTLWMIVATTFGTLVTFAWLWWQAEKLMAFGLSVDLVEWRRLIAMGLPLAGSQILIVALLRGDTFILSLFHSATDVGLYGLPTKILEILTTLSYIFGGLMMGYFVRAVSDGDEEAFARRLRDAMETVLVVGLGIMVFLQFHSAQLLGLIGGDIYTAGAPALRFVGISIVAEYLVHVLRYAFTSREKQATMLRLDVVVFLSGMALYLLLIPPLSYTGAALATAINEVVTAAGFFFLARREGLRPFAVMRTALILASSVILAGALWACQALGINWLLAVPISGLIYLAALTATGVVSRQYVRRLMTIYVGI